MCAIHNRQVFCARIVFLVAGVFLLVGVSQTGCRAAVQGPPSWTFGVQTTEHITELFTSTYVSNIGIYGQWVTGSDMAGAYGDNYSSEYGSISDGAGYYYCVDCRVNAQWQWWSDEYDGSQPNACGDNYYYGKFPVAPGNIYELPCPISIFGHQSAGGYAVDYIPNEYWRWQDAAVPPPASGGPDTLTANGYLYPNQQVYSANGAYWLLYQSDGNLVLYSGGGAVWATGTVGTTPGFTVMADDGNLLVYDGGGNPVWQSYTSGHDGAYMAVMNGGSIVIYNTDGTASWWSGTGGF